MKKHVSISLFVVFLLLNTPTSAQDAPPENIPDFAGLRIRIFETATGNELVPIPQSEYPKDWDPSKTPDGATAHVFRHKDKFCVMLVNSKKSKPGTAAFGLNSNFGELSIGILPYGEKKNLPKTTVKDKTAEFQLAYGKPTVTWTDDAEFAVPKPRKDVSLELAEYGAADKWKDVTDIFNENLICGVVNLQGTNNLFGGDPAPGIPKSMIITYAIGDEDKMLEIRENGWVRIQYNPKDYFYRLTPKTDATFKFVIGK